MTKEEVVEQAIRLFREQAVTVSKSRTEVSIQCSNAENARTIFEWLAGIEDRIERYADETPSIDPEAYM